MPFGAELLDDGRVRFRIWAPGARRIELCLDERDDGERLMMVPQPDGWFACLTERAAAGSRYWYCLEDGMRVPDPASRYQPDDVHGPSEVVDPCAFDWTDADWRGRPWEEVVIYELHVGSYTPQGTLAAVREKLAYLSDLGFTAIELMPLADFPGAHNWGYDGVLPFAPDSRYGRPEDLKQLVQDAHALGLMVFLDVVYNHFGPEGNYLHHYAPEFFTARHHTPWGAGLNFDGPGSRTVRDFFIHNALYWLEEFNLDGLRLDAVHAILDDSRPDILQELAAAVQGGPGRHRRIHLVLENDDNAARYLGRADGHRSRCYVAQWNDDFHHACHVLLTGESQGYYRDYADDPLRHLLRCLGEGFAYQGEPSSYRGGRHRGESSGHLPPTAFVSYLQNHDQIGNRAFGERLSTLAAPAALRAATALLLLAPAPPLLFMGQEWGSRQQFLFFCDVGEHFRGSVTEGRRREFARFPEFRDPHARAQIPDPMARSTFDAAVLEWTVPDSTEGGGWIELHRHLLRLRREWLVPHLRALVCSRWARPGAGTFLVEWRSVDRWRFRLVANLTPARGAGVSRPAGECLYATHEVLYQDTESLPPWSLAWYVQQPMAAADA